jgi:hypothetical protein
MASSTYIGAAKNEAIQEELEKRQGSSRNIESSNAGQGPLSSLGHRAPELEGFVHGLLDCEVAVAEVHDAATD